jgi:tRNA-dihydrouridine synthase A
VLQLGGNNPENLAKCSVIAESMGYDEINLNVKI